MAVSDRHTLPKQAEVALERKLQRLYERPVVLLDLGSAFAIVEHSHVEERRYAAHEEMYRVRLRLLDMVDPSKHDQKDALTYRSTLNAILIHIDHDNKTVRLGPSGHIVLTPSLRNHGIGSYLLAHVICFARKRAPDYRVEDGTLSEVDAKTKAERDLRNAFYRKPMLTVNAKEAGGGSFGKERVDQLLPYYNEAKVQDVDMADALAELARLRRRVPELEAVIASNKGAREAAAMAARTVFWRGVGGALGIGVLIGLLVMWNIVR